MAHEEDLCTDVLSLALKQTKAGPWTPFSSVLRIEGIKVSEGIKASETITK